MSARDNPWFSNRAQDFPFAFEPQPSCKKPCPRLGERARQRSTISSTKAGNLVNLTAIIGRRVVISSRREPESRPTISAVPKVATSASNEGPGTAPHLPPSCPECPSAQAFDRKCSDAVGNEVRHLLPAHTPFPAAGRQNSLND